MIIGLHGKKRSGKDTCADYIVNKYGFVKIGFADMVRESLYALNPWIDGYLRYADAIDTYGYEYAKDNFPEVRRLLQHLGTEVGRNLIHPDVWVDLLNKRLIPGFNYVIPDCRMENEAQFVLDAGGPVFHIIRETGLEDSHSSELPLSEKFISHHIYNGNTLEDLYATIDHLISHTR